MSSKILLRRGTAAEWSSVNPILGNGEVGIETDTLKIKIGNGTSTWLQLTSYANVTPSELTSAINSIIDLSPSTLDTLNELAAAINNDSSFSTTVNNLLNGKVSKSGGDTITSATTSTIGLIIKATTSQTANILEIQNPTAGVIFAVNPAAEVISYRRFSVLSPNASTIGLIVKGAASQTANLQEWQNGAGTILSKVDASGSFYAGNSYFTSSNTYVAGTLSSSKYILGGDLSLIPVAGGQSVVSSWWGLQLSGLRQSNVDYTPSNVGAANVAHVIMPLTQSASIGLLIKGAASQTADLQQWQSSDGTVLAKVDKDGQITASNISLATYGGIYGNGSYMVFNPADIRIVSAGLSVGASSVGTSAQLQVTNGVSSTVGLIIKGASSQSASLTEWQDSSGSVLANIDANGQGSFKSTTLTASSSAGSALTLVAASGQTEPLLITAGGAQITAGGNYFKAPGIEATYVMNVTSGGSGTVPFTVKGAVSQNANLQEWKNSSDTILTKITNDGRLVVSHDTAQQYLLHLVQGPSSSAAHIASQGSGYLGWIGTRTDSTRRFAFESDPTNNGATFGLWQYDSSGLNSIQVFGSSYGNGMTIPKILAQPLSNSITPLIVKGIASQTADLTQWQDSAGLVKALIGSGGNGVFNGIRSGSGSTTGAINAYTTAAQVGILVRGAASQTANLTEWQDSSGTILSKVDSSGNITAPSYNLSNSLYSLRKTIKKTVGDGTAVAANTTYDLFQFNFSSSLQGTFYFQVSMRGSGYGQNLTYSLPVTYAMDWLSQGYSGNLFTNNATWVSLSPQTFSGRHLMVGDNLKLQAKVSANIIYFRLKANAALSSGGNSPYFDVYIQHSEEFAGCTITEYSTVGTDTDSQTTLANFLSSKGGTTELFNPVTIFSNSALNTPIKIKGFSSQTANLQEWQNSSGTVIASIGSGGNSVFTGRTFIGGNSDYSAFVNVNIPSAGRQGIVIRANASQSANLQEWQDSNSNIVSKVDASGNYWINAAPATSGTVERSSAYLYLVSNRWDGSASTGEVFGLNNFRFGGAGAVNAFALHIKPSYTANAYLSVAGDTSRSVGVNVQYPSASSGYGQFGVQIADASYKGIVVKSVASQTANLQEWQNSAGTIMAYVSSDGTTSVPSLRTGYEIRLGTTSYFNAALSIFPLSASNIGMVIRSRTSQTANLTEWQNDTGAVLANVDSSGNIYPNSIISTGGNANSFGGNTTPGVILTVNTSNALGLVVKGGGAQTLNLQEWQNSSGTVLASVANNGELTLKPIPFSGGVSGGIYMRDTSNAWAAGSFKIKVDNAGTPRFGFTAPNAASEALTIVGNSVGIQTESPSALFQVTSNNASNIVSIIKGYASQTANLTEWQNSSGTVLTYVAANGTITTPGIVSGANGLRSNAAMSVQLPVFTDSAQLAVSTGGAGYKGILVRGAASQSANLQEWQNSDGTVLAQITASGSLELNGKDVELMNIMGAF